MPERHLSGILDTSVYIDLGLLDPAMIPAVPELTAITFAELQQGVAMAKDDVARTERTEKLLAAIAEFEPLPFDGAAASRYGTLIGLTIAAGRDPRSRRLDLMIASIASTRGLPLFTRNADDFKGLERTLTVIAV